MPSKKIQEAINQIRAAEVDSVTLLLFAAFREEDDAKCISEGIKEARVPLTLGLTHNNIGEAGAKFISEGIKEARVPLTLHLEENKIGDAGAKFLSEGIKEARVPLTLYLSDNNIGEAGAKFLSEGIKEARFPLTLNLQSNRIGNEGAKFLAEGIKEARVPLTMCLSSNEIGEAGVKFISEGIKEARVPLTLNLSWNNIGEVGAKFLSEGIKEARFPITLYLWSNGIGEAGAKFFSEGIKEARVPLTLNLHNNNIGEEGAKFLSEGIKEARVPLTLNLRNNNIGEEGAKFLSEGIKVARVPLKLSYEGMKVQDNFIIDAGETPSEFFAKLGFNPFNLLGLRPILTQTPVVQELLGLNYPKDIAIIIQDYAPDLDYLAWKAVAAIRAVEGASRDNTYASIDYDLLSAVYSTAPVVAVAPALEEKAMEDDGQEARREGPVAVIIETPQSLNAKAIEYEKAGDLVNALDCKERVLKIYQEVYNEAHPEVARTLNAIGVLHEKLGNAEKSLDYKEAALKMRRVLHEAAHLDIAGSLNNVGIAYELLGYIRLGIYYKEQALKMMRSLYPDNHLAVVACLNNVALGYQKLRDAEDYSHYKGRADDVKQAIEQQNQERADGFKGQGTLAYTDNSYPEYYNTGIDQVLELRLAGHANAISLKSRYFGNDLSYQAQALAADVGYMLLQGKQVIVPINLYNKHWLGLVFQGFGDKVVVTYMDSEQRAMLPQLMEELAHGFAMNSYKSSFVTAKLALQSYNNCGYEVIENFVYYLTGTRATQHGAPYVQSLLVENSLLDPDIYGLKIEENAKLIGFLSNSKPIGINEITLFKEQGGETKYERTAQSYNIAKLTTALHRASIWFKTLDFVVESARLAQEPSMPLLKKVALDYAYLQAMVSGVNGYSVMISGAETLYQLQLGEYQKAFNVASSTISAMALPVILAMANRPYLGLAYGAWMAAVSAYGAITNAYSFALEFSNEDAAFRSAMAYKDLAVKLATSPVQSWYDFESKATEYKLQVNDLLFDKEKANIEEQMKKYGEFGQKVFEYIHLPSLAEKYGLMNDVIRGILSEEEAQALQANNIRVRSKQQSYEHCMELRSEGSKSSSEYYCYNLLDQVLDHVELTAQGGIVIIEHL